MTYCNEASFVPRPLPAFRLLQYKKKIFCLRAGRARERFFWAQFSRKLVRLYEYSYFGLVLIMNIHIAHDTKVFVTLRERKKKKQ